MRAAWWAVALVVCCACGTRQSGGSSDEAPDAEAPHAETPATPQSPAPVPETDGGTTTTPSPTAICVPAAAGPHWGLEGEPIAFEARCSTGWSSADARFELVNGPEGAAIDPVTGAFSWTPRLDQAAVYSLTIRELSTGETGTVKVGIADAFNDPNNAKVDPLTYTEEYGVPVMHLTYSDKLSSWEYRPAALVYRGHRYEIGAKYRGATSLDFPKRSFTFEFSDADEFKDPLVDFGNRDKLVLITSFNDNSYVRPRLAFELWRRMDPENIKVKTFPVVLYRNGVYWGLYTAADHVDSDLIRRHGLNKDGNLHKAFHADANFGLYMSTGEEKWALWQGYEKKEGTPAEGEPHAKDDIADLTGFVINASDEAFRTELGQRVVLRDYENWWIFITMILGTDSGGKNAYHYRDTAVNGPFRYIPWDLDASFGQDWDTRRTSAQWRYGFAAQNGMFRRMLADPALIEPVRTRYRALLRGPLTKETVLTLYDQLQAEVREVALRDEARWGADYRGFERWADRTDLLSYEEEAAYVRQWIDTRWDTLLNAGPP